MAVVAAGQSADPNGTINTILADVSLLSFRGEHKPLGLLYLPRGQPQVRHLRPHQPEQAAHQAGRQDDQFFVAI